VIHHRAMAAFFNLYAQLACKDMPATRGTAAAIDDAHRRGSFDVDDAARLTFSTGRDEQMSMALAGEKKKITDAMDAIQARHKELKKRLREELDCCNRVARARRDIILAR
jgi:hypothetical protein